MSSYTLFDGQIYYWGERIEWTPEIPPNRFHTFRLSHDLRTVVEMTKIVQIGFEKSPFIRICCDVCNKISKKIRVASFQWPWTDRLYMDAAHRWRADGVYIKKELASQETAYCPACYMRILSQHKMAWDCDKTQKFIKKTLKEISNGTNQNNRATSPVSRGHTGSCKERADGHGQSPKYNQNCGAD